MLQWRMLRGIWRFGVLRRFPEILVRGRDTFPQGLKPDSLVESCVRAEARTIRSIGHPFCLPDILLA